MSDKIQQIMVMGDEAVAHAAIDSGVKGIFGYPGTPSTEIFECAHILADKYGGGRTAQWAANEKVAYEMALGASYAGNRAMVSMKHVGLNVAMDAFVNSGITGVNGGLVVVVADDPGMHSSQNEQDTRYLADFALIPCLEPSTPQEAYDFTKKAFELSEFLSLPIVLRLVTRLAHSRGLIEPSSRMEVPVEKGMPPTTDSNKWVLIPSNARVQYQSLRDKVPLIQDTMAAFNNSQINDRSVGVIVAGMGRAYFEQICREFPEFKNYSRLDIAGYPLKEMVVRDFAQTCGKVYVFEENYPFIEDLVLKLAPTTIIHGRRDASIPIAGELSLLKLRNSLGIKSLKARPPINISVPNRPPKLCDGCGHSDTFIAVKEAFKNIGVADPRIFGDIGCYTLGYLPPYNAIHSAVEMGASLGMALGAGHVGMTPVVGVIGDSTFFHSGLTSLVSLADCKGNVNFVVMDNRITAMTGQQKTVATNVMADIARAVGLKDDQIHTFEPHAKKHAENTAALEKIFSDQRPAFIIFRRECVEAQRKGIYEKVYQAN